MPPTARSSLHVRPGSPDESGESYESECRPAGPYGALKQVPAGPYGALKPATLAAHARLAPILRDAIEGGTYETDDKLTAAIDGLLPDLA